MKLKGCLISVIACSKTALVVTAIFPLKLSTGSMQVNFMTGFDADCNSTYIAAGAIEGDGVNKLQTVTYVDVEDLFIDR